MLFFHQQVELIKAPHDCAIALLIVRERFTQPDKCKTTFVFDRVAHVDSKEGAKLGVSGAPANSEMLRLER
jgi:hypothetical protein